MPSKRALPNDLAVEQAILGLMIIDDATATTLLASLEIDDFCEENPQNRTIFSAIKRIKECKNTPNFQPYTYMNEALNMAIQALQKQLPQYPIYEADGYADGVLVYDTWVKDRSTVSLLVRIAAHLYRSFPTTISLVSSQVCVPPSP